MDADLRAIYRRRRQDGRCVRCGGCPGKAALCVVCRVAWRYCPSCEEVYPCADAYARKPSAVARATERCRACTRAQYERRRHVQAPRNAGGHRLLPQMIQLYRQGYTVAEIAGAVGLLPSTTWSAITDARRAGRWPAGLRRGKDWRKGRKAE